MACRGHLLCLRQRRQAKDYVTTPGRRNWYPDGYRRLAAQIARFPGQGAAVSPRTQQLAAGDRSILLKTMASIRLGELLRERIHLRAPRHQRRSGLALWLLLAEVGSAVRSGEELKHEQSNDLRRTDYTRVQPRGDTTMAQLRIIASNDQPERESNFPETWLLHKETDTIEVQVRHDRLQRPFVRDKSA